MSVKVFPVNMTVGERAHGQLAADGQSFNSARQCYLRAQAGSASLGVLSVRQVSSVEFATGPFVVTFANATRPANPPELTVKDYATVVNGELRLKFRVRRGMRCGERMRITVERDGKLAATGTFLVLAKLTSLHSYSQQKCECRVLEPPPEITLDDLLGWWMHD